MSLEDSLRAIRDARGLRVNEDLIVWAARLESGRQRSGRSGVTVEVLRDTWRKMHITVSEQENADLMLILDEHRADGATPASRTSSNGDAAGPAESAVPAAPPAESAVPAAPPNGRFRPPSWYSAPDPEPDPQEQPTATPAVAAANTPEPAGPAEPPEWFTAAKAQRPPAPVVTRKASASAAPAVPGPWTGPLPAIGTFAAEADVMNPRDGYLSLSVAQAQVELLWEAAEDPAELVLYLVVGSGSRIPNTAAEADRLAVTADLHAVVPAGHRYYAIFAYRGGNPIAAARDRSAVRHAVGQVVPSPVGVEFTVNPDSVVLEWQQPPDVAGVQLRRSRPDEPLPGYADASLVKSVLPGQTNFLDLDVEPGRNYRYELVCHAPAPKIEGGQDFSPPWSSGMVTIPAIPERVDGLEGLMVDAGGQVRCRLSWPAVRRGKVSIFHKPGDPGTLAEVPPDRVLTPEELTRLPLGSRVVWGLTTVQDRDLLDGFAVDIAASPEWCYTPVTEMAGTFVIGRSVVLTHVGAIGAVELTDRIFWQFLRFEWPTGAAEVVVEHDGSTVRTSRQKFELYGGVRLALPAHPSSLTIWGTRTYRGVPLRGQRAEVRYPGRQVLYYQVEPLRSAARRLYVRAEIPMPATDLAVIGGTSLYPLTPDQSAQPGFGVVYPISAPAGGLNPAGWASWEFAKPDPVNYLRLFARSGGSSAIAAIEMPPAPVPVDRRALRCPNCLAPPHERNQYFRCARDGDCQPVEDKLLSRVRGTPTIAKPWSAREMERDGPVGQIFCERCRKPTREEFCSVCGESLPTADWWRTDCFAATLLGARFSGKTTMLQAQSYTLLEGLAETWGGHAGALDPYSRVLMKRYHDEWESGRLQQGTIPARQNRELLRPIQIGIDFPQRPRPVAISLFDVAGEDMEDPDQLSGYAKSMLSGDALIYLVDPLQIEEVRTALAGFVTLPPEGGATPVQGLQNVISVLRQTFGGTDRLPIRIAVVFSKFDAIQQAASVPGSPIAGTLPFGSAMLRDPYNSPHPAAVVCDQGDSLAVHHEARTLLSMLGGTAILNMVERNFATFRYFVTSSTGHTPPSNTIHSSAKAPHRLFDPLRWMIEG